VALVVKSDEELIMRLQRIESLKNSYARLEAQLAFLATKPAACPAELKSIKRQKLWIKDQLILGKLVFQARPN
jgi:hypothetical protein